MHEYKFAYKGRHYPYTTNKAYQCEFCRNKATWNAITLKDPRYTFVCDRHFEERCQTDKAARFREPPSSWDGRLTTIGEFLQGVEELKAIYASQGRAGMGD